MVTGGPVLPEDFILGEESREGREAGNSKRRNRHAPKGLGHVLAQAAHVAHVLFTAKAVNDGSGGKEEQRLEEGVSHEVEDARTIGRNAAAHEHEAKLRNRRV